MAFRQISSLRKGSLSPLAMIRQIFQCETLSGLTGITIMSAYTDPVIIGELLDELQGKFDSIFQVRLLLDIRQFFQSADAHADPPEIVERLADYSELQLQECREI
ncbi:hypothetical protein [Geobacter sp.]|uniref:hypothetical protein n=1 Tax=Geobacter sp. TaxID=46610 RepID=UPI00260EF917|nr:hypothetical protein [Geobacter sp.]